MAKPRCALFSTPGERCQSAAAVNDGGAWACPAHATLAPGWLLVRESDAVVVLRELARSASAHWWTHNEEDRMSMITYFADLLAGRVQRG